MKLELSNNEVRGVGERRWIRKYGKKWLISLGGILVVSIILCFTLECYVETKSIQILILSPILVLFVVGYIKFMFKMDKAGKAFLKEQQQ